MEQIHTTTIDPVRIIKAHRFEDARGFFSESFAERRFTQAGMDFRCIQDNHVLSARAHTLRGIHYQLPPFAQAKLVRVISGAAMDFAIDLRRGSPTFGKHVATLLTKENWLQVYVPEGFGHATLALEPGTEFIYKVNAPYSRDHERGIRWDDPDLAIPWGVNADAITLSQRDQTLPMLRDQPDLPAAFVDAARPTIHAKGATPCSDGPSFSSSSRSSQPSSVSAASPPTPRGSPRSSSSSS